MWLWLLYVVIGLIIGLIVLGELFYGYSRHRTFTPSTLSSMASELVLHTKDNVEIHAWHVKADGNRYAILVHGHFDSGLVMISRYGGIFHDAGYHLVAVDLRNHGRSNDRLPITYGVVESFDVSATIEWVCKQSPTQVVLVGTSMGSIASLIATKYLPTKVDGLLLDSTFVNVDDTFRLNLRKHHLPPTLIYPPLRQYMKWRYSLAGFSFDQFPDILSLEMDTASKLPMLIVNGTDDQEVPKYDLTRIKESVTQASVASIPGGEHSRLYQKTQFTELVRPWLQSLPTRKA